MASARSNRRKEHWITLAAPPRDERAISQKKMRRRKEIEESGGVAFYGPTDDDFMVLGEAPGEREVAEGIPFVGPSGQLLRGLMAREHLRPEGALWNNVVHFWPKDEKTLKTRPPSDDEIRERRPALLEELGYGSSRKILLVGATALRTFRPDLKLTQVHGQCFVWNSTWLVMPTFHPAAALRNYQEYLPQIRADLAKWREVVECDLNQHARWARFLGVTCIKCRDRMTNFDIDGVPMCFKHWDGGKALAKARRHWGQSFLGEQLGLLDLHEEPDTSALGDVAGSDGHPNTLLEHSAETQPSR